jgi:hypothetical protein|tara:strand:+ start:997 stop:1671 length:675 start_codon:yes stop_codon:yes gene_type:complete
MFKDDVTSQIIGTVKIYDKETGKVLLEKRNAIHPGNMAYVLASALGGKTTSVNANGSPPVVNWMAFGNGGSNSTTTLAYRAPRVFGTYDQLPITSSNSTLYAKTYEQETVNTVYFPGQDMGNNESVPANTSKIVCSVEVSHADYEDAIQAVDPTLSLPETDSSTDTLSTTAFTFDEIGLMCGVTDNNTLDEDKTLMVTHVTFHPVLLSANRTIIIDYTITIQVN